VLNELPCQFVADAVGAPGDDGVRADVDVRHGIVPSISLDLGKPLRGDEVPCCNPTPMVGNIAALRAALTGGWAKTLSDSCRLRFDQSYVTGQAQSADKPFCVIIRPQPCGIRPKRPTYSPLGPAQVCFYLSSFAAALPKLNVVTSI
jgi:hypothetical protein